MYPRPTSHSTALGPGCAGPQFMLPPGAAEHHASLQRPVDHKPTSGAPACAVDPAILKEADDPIKHTLSPYVTGTSILAVRYKDGVAMAADMLGSYGSTKRYKGLQRMIEVNPNCVVGASGEVSDFQQIQRYLDELSTADFCQDDGITLQPSEVFSYLTRVMYNRRSKMNPLWNSLVVAGVSKQGEPFLGCVAMNGTHYQSPHVATGFGGHLAVPLFREAHRPDMSEEEAVALLKSALRVCYYRDKQSINKFQVATATAAGVKISEPFALDVKWDYQAYHNPTAMAPGTW
ncbi:unnamed protein product [Pedinophyceae sp. YPF-701]|nr:unnamed protein product [Pedinophyceae sp. YPF-701]